jgi:type II secretory pathway component PulK
MTRARDEKGVVLLLVLVIIVLTISMVFAFAETSLIQVASTKQRIARVKASLLARSGVPIAMRALVDDVTQGAIDELDVIDSSRDPWALLAQQPIEVPGGGELRIRVLDAGNRLNLNALVDEDGFPHPESLAFLTAALERIIENMPGRTEEKLYRPDELAEAILDWIDSDDQTRLGDNEAAYYEEAQATSGPLDRPLYSLASLGAIPDLDERLLDALADYFTIYPTLSGLTEGSGVNPNTAPPHVLGLIYQGTSGQQELLIEEDVFRILRARDEGRIFCPQSEEDPCVSFQNEILEFGGIVFPPLSYRSQTFVIQSEARYGEVRACVEAVIDRSDPRELLTLSYRLEC